MDICFYLAGVAGIEPANGGFRVRSLTTWLHPKTLINYKTKKMSIEEYWNNFTKVNKLPKDTKYVEAFKFGFSDKQADELLDLVLQGKKIATTSPYFKYEDAIKVGDYSIVLDSKEIPRCIIQTTDTKVLHFNEATFDLIKDEGEDEVLDTWIEGHRIFLKEACKEENEEFKEDMLILFEHFRVVYK